MGWCADVIEMQRGAVEPMTVEIREIIAARRQDEKELRELQQWAHGQRQEPLTPELKSRWLKIVAEHGGIGAAAQAMDSLATQHMPRTMQ